MPGGFWLLVVDEEGVLGVAVCEEVEWFLFEADIHQLIIIKVLFIGN